ncbi:hypothetical protein LTR53_015568 [Teratosphaeriaceae sp. CCFEE 6253]|nr:hypothetical protein LTR53_015568 [Teratosphaeriaceae sp. CCFEE 6253]
MASLPSPPFIEIHGVANFRGVGQGHVGPGLIYRSADPTRASNAGLEKMSKDLGIRVIFDLRSAPEIQRLGKEWEGLAVQNPDVFQKYGIARQWVPVFAEEDYGPEQVGLRYKEYTRSGSEGFVKAYHDILLSGTKAYGTVFRHLAQEKPTPCLVHCTAGKDRTGVLVALLFLHAGAPADEIADEYALTDLGLAEKKPEFIERLLLNPALGGNREGVENMVSSKRGNMLATLDMIKREHGTAEEYMKKSCGLSDDEIKRLRKNLRDGALEGL